MGDFLPEPRSGFQCRAFSLDETTRQLRRDGQLVHVSPKAFDLLALLVARRPQVVSKADLFAALWPDTHVTDSSLAILVAEVRAALNETARHAGCIRTVHRRGYAFQEPDATPAASITERMETGYWLETPAGPVRLAPGATIVGRDPGAGVLIDAPSVSRQHARICIDAGRIVVEDLGSKNGTRAGQRDVTSAQEVVNGDVLRFGTVAVTLRVRMPDPTRTESDSQ